CPIVCYLCASVFVCVSFVFSRPLLSCVSFISWLNLVSSFCTKVSALRFFNRLIHRVRSMQDAVAHFAIRLICGIGLALCAMPRKGVAAAFFRITLLVVLGLAVLFALASD